MPNQRGNRLSHNESQLPYLTARVPQTTIDQVAELQERTGLCKRDVLKEAIRLFVLRQRDSDNQRNARSRADSHPPLPASTILPRGRSAAMQIFQRPQGSNFDDVCTDQPGEPPPRKITHNKGYDI